MPASDQHQLDLASAFAVPRFRWIAWLDVVGAAPIVLGSGWLVLSGAQLKLAALEPRLFPLLTLGIVMIALGSYGLRAGHILWAASTSRHACSAPKCRATINRHV